MTSDIRKKMVTASFCAVLLLCLLTPFYHAYSSTQPKATPLTGQEKDSINNLSTKSSGTKVPFLKNTGQVPSDNVAFYAQTFGGTVFLTQDGELLYSLLKFGEHEKSSTFDPMPELRPVVGSTVLKEKLIGIKTPDIEGQDRAKVKIQWHLGDNRETWRRAVQAFNEVSLGEIYDGVKMHLHAHAGSVEKIFTVTPYADPSQIRFSYEGVKSLEIDENGMLVATTELGPVMFSAPIAFQDHQSEQKSVEVAYKLENNAVAFELGEYDKSLPLTIDPLLASTYVGGRQEDSVEAITVHVTEGLWDTGGNAYVAGYTISPDFPIGDMNSGNRTANYDVFVAKYNRSLTELEATCFIGGSGEDIPTSIAVMESIYGTYLYVAGYTTSPDFPTYATIGARGEKDVFVARFDMDLASRDATIVIGGTLDDVPTDMKADGEALFISGYTDSSDFHTTSGAYNRYHRGSSDAFVMKVGYELTSVEAGTFLGGSGLDKAYGLALCTTNVYIGGYTESLASSFTPSLNTRWSTNSGAGDGFLMTLKKDLGQNYYKMTFLGGTKEDAITAVGVHTGTNLVFAAGYTYSTDFKTNAPYPSVPGGGADAFVVSFSKDMVVMPRCVYVGGSGDDFPTAMTVTRMGTKVPYKYMVDVAGYTKSPNFPVQQNAFSSALRGGEDGFIFRMATTNINVNSMEASTYVGGFQNDRIKDIYVYSSDSVDEGLGGTRVWVAGSTESEDFPFSDAAHTTIYSGNKDGFVTRFGGELAFGSVKWKTKVVGRAGTPALDWEGNIYFGTDGGKVYSLNKYGAVRWEFDINLINRDLGFVATVTLSPNGVLYACDNGVGAVTGEMFTRMHALDAETGEPKWTYETAIAGYHNYGFVGSPVLGGDDYSVVYGTINNKFNQLGSKAALVAIKDNGYEFEELWMTDFDEQTFASPIMAPVVEVDNGNTVTNDYLFFHTTNLEGSRTENFYMIDPEDGSVVQAMGIDGAIGASHTSSSMAADNDKGIYFGTRANKMIKIARDVFSINWEQAASDMVHGSPVYGNGYAYFGDDNGRVYGINSSTPGSGRLEWQVPTEASHLSIGMNGNIYVGSGHPARVHALDRMGTTVLWSTFVDDYNSSNAISGTAISGDGTVYVGAGSNMVALFCSEPPGDFPWATFHHDLMRSGNYRFRSQPLAPEWVAVTNAGTFDMLRVSWSAVYNAAIYDIWKTEIDDPENFLANAEKLTSTPGITFEDFNVEAGKKYWYAIQARHSLGGSPMSVPAYGGLPPNPPETIWSSDDKDDQITTGWGTNPYTEVYQLWRSDVEDVLTAELLADNLDVYEYVDTDIDNGVKYFYWLKGGNEFGLSDFSTNSVGGTTPVRPVNIAASEGDYDDKVLITWDLAAGVDTYELWSSREDELGTAVQIALVTGSSYEDSSPEVVPFVTNFYWLRSTNDFGISPFTDFVSGYRGLPKPLDVDATRGDYPTKVVVTWTPVPDASSYEIWRSTTDDSDTAERIVYTFSNGTYSDTGVELGKGYYYWMKSVSDYGVSGFTSPSALGGTPPKRPVDVKASQGKYHDRVDITWSPVDDATSYELLRGVTRTPGNAEVIQIDITDTEFSDTSADVGRYYYYWVRARNSFSTSLLSSEAFGFREIGLPTDLTASAGQYSN
ncbi:MAG: PQQ-binding-like beta-propeller repeat protein [Lentisphaerae bacterium]|nr:PQQ-binding-like beta-propeller repeat protein [Lentisphaerota bacterium]